jgi:hypothetical protein
VDDPPNCQRAITPRFLRHLHRLSSSLSLSDPVRACVLDHAVDIIIGGFFFATRPCEVVLTKTPGRTKTLEMRDLAFRDRQGQVIPHHSSDLLDAAFVTVTWRNQKNGLRMDSRSQRRTLDPILCPVRRFARVVLRILLSVPNASPTTMFCTVGTKPSCAPTHINSDYTLHLLRSTCAMFGGKMTFGFHPHEIGNRSICSGAAMALFLKDHSTAKIMILGRWSSNAFLVYIQVLEWTNNMSRDMVSFNSFLDVGLYDIASASDPRVRRRTVSLNGQTSAMPIPQFHLHD